MKQVGALIAALILSTSLSAVAKPVVFQVGDEKQRDVVSFTSDAPIELIVGKTSKINGNVTIDDSFDLSKKPLEAQFEVDLASIDTGIELRNEHMRDNFLETAKYPKATFNLKTLKTPVVLKPGQKATLSATGDFTLHGKTVTKTVPVTVTYLRSCPATATKMEGCDLIQIKSNFSVPFKDHSIKRPEIVFQKLADTVIVTVAATAYTKK
jgi:polyisoprenoid-binding protein YceI